MVTHYIADYFTLPHNKKFTGSLKDHVNYEEVLKHSMRKYVSQENVENQPLIRMTLSSVEEICEFIKNCHREYIRMSMSGQEIDCRHSVEVCRQVMEAVIELLHQREAALVKVMEASHEKATTWNWRKGRIFKDLQKVL